MKQQIALAAVASIFLGMAGTVQAGNPNHAYPGGYYGGYDRNHPAHRYGDRRHDRYSRHGHRRHNHFGRGLAIVAGAVVLGSVIHAISKNESRRKEHRSGPPGPVPDYWYRIDTNGQCVEVRLNRQGREVWTYVDPAYCN